MLSSRWDLNFWSMYTISKMLIIPKLLFPQLGLNSEFNPNQMVPLSLIALLYCKFSAETSDIAEIQLKLFHNFWKDFHTRCIAFGLEGTSAKLACRLMVIAGQLSWVEKVLHCFHGWSCCCFTIFWNTDFHTQCCLLLYIGLSNSIKMN